MMWGKENYKLNILSFPFQADKVKEKKLASHSTVAYTHEIEAEGWPWVWHHPSLESEFRYGLTTEPVWNKQRTKQTKKRDRRE